MFVLDQRRVALVGEDPLPPEFRRFHIEAGDIGKAAAEDDDVRVEDVDDAGQGAGQAVMIAGHGRRRLGGDVGGVPVVAR